MTDKLVEALEPFARYANALLKRRDGAEVSPVPDDRLVFGIDGQNITIGDLRRAVAALASRPDTGAEAVALADGFEAEQDGTFTIRFPSGHAITAWADGKLAFTTYPRLAGYPFVMNVAHPPAAGAGDEAREGLEAKAGGA
jgi:hypothetical protein